MLYEVITRAVLQATGLDQQTYRQILSGFFLDNRQTVGKIERAVEANDTDSLLHLSHQLKGSAANIGARSIERAAADLEEGCRLRQSAELLGGLATGLKTELEGLLARLGFFAHEDEGEPPAVSRITSYNVCYTKLLRGSSD